MTTADDLRVLRDALDSIAHGALPRWGMQTTIVGKQSTAAAIQVYEKFVRALFAESAAKVAIDAAQRSEDQHRTHAEALTARCEAVEAEVERLQRLLDHATQTNPGTSTLVMLMNEASEAKAERRQLRRRLVECRPWVGVCPLEPARINEMCLVRDLADDSLAKVPE